VAPASTDWTDWTDWSLTGGSRQTPKRVRNPAQPSIAAMAALPRNATTVCKYRSVAMATPGKPKSFDDAKGTLDGA